MQPVALGVIGQRCEDAAGLALTDSTGRADALQLAFQTLQLIDTLTYVSEMHVSDPVRLAMRTASIERYQFGNSLKRQPEGAVMSDEGQPG